MSHHHHQQRRGGRFIPPKVGSIHHGTVTRIESYGCFVKFTYNDSDDETTDNNSNSNSISGLVHISQCSKMKITNVADVVSLNDMVYIKIMEVIPPDDRGGGRHCKVKLSMKYVHQDTGQDLDPDGVLMEEDLFRQRSSNNNNNGHQQGGRRDENVDGTGGANSILGRSLASNIGISSAIDPGSLILKGRSGGGTSNNSATFNGYALVGEDEGELPPDTTATTAANETLREDPTAPPSSTVRPMGRGRATTLPAWMTRQDNDVNATGSDERLGLMKDEKGPLDIRNDDESNSNENADDRRRRKHHRKDRKQRHHRSSRSSRKKHKRQRHSRRRSSRSRSHSYSISSDYDDNSSSSLYSRSRSPAYRKKKRKDKNKKKKSKHRDDGHHRRDRRDYYSSGSSRSRSRDRSDKHEGHGKEKEGHSSFPSGFANVDEARAIMEKLERHQQER
ncbi:hypothetical protein ACHAWC_003254 [Mediolabrus comicus]